MIGTCVYENEYSGYVYRTPSLYKKEAKSVEIIKYSSSDRELKPGLGELGEFKLNDSVMLTWMCVLLTGCMDWIYDIEMQMGWDFKSETHLSEFQSQIADSTNLIG